MKKFIIVISLALAVILCLTACGKNGDNDPTAAPEALLTAAPEALLTDDKEPAASEKDTEKTDENNSQEDETMNEKNPVATITMKDGGVIKVELYPNIAPNTVNNFISLANKGFYDGVIFHRVISGFMIQGGDPTGTGFEGPGYSIKGEFALNGVKNQLKHTRGVISMARSKSYDSAGSQFFIMHKDAAYLDGQYAAFGKVIEGLDVVDAIAGVDTDMYDKPLTDQTIKTITVDTFGVAYAEPETLPEK